MPTTRTPLTNADRVAAALQVYADAIRLGQTPAPNYITLHAAALPRDQFLRFADLTDAPIEVVTYQRSDDGHHSGYARVSLPFGSGILPDDVYVAIHATCTDTSDAARQLYDTHNRECIVEEPADGDQKPA